MSEARVAARVSCRPFTLLDGMILIAGSAVGIAGWRARLDPRDYDPDHWITSLHFDLGSALLMSSALLLVMRLRRPRPPIRRVVWQPGTAACFAALGNDIWVTTDFFIGQLIVGDPALHRSASDWLAVFTGVRSYPFASVVPITWTLMALGRRWRPEPGWIDRSGRVVGWGWIAWSLTSQFML